MPSGPSSSSPTRPPPGSSSTGSSTASGPASRRTDPLERLNKETERRTNVVGIFPTRASALRLVGMILAEQDDKWQEGRRYFRPETMAAIDAATTEEVTPLLMASYRIRREDDRLLHHELGLDLTGTKTPEGTYSTRGLDAIAAFSVFSAPSG